MKRILFLCSMMAFGVTMTDVRAQVYTEIMGGATTSRGIIREQNISYYEDANGQGVFVYLSAFSGNVNTIKTPPTWSIRDFHVVNRIAYFCGIDKSDRTALLGHFDITNLQTGSGSINFNRDINICPMMSILNRLAVHKAKGNDTVSIMAIGRRENGLDPDKYGADRVVYIKDYASMTGCIFRNPGNPNELFWDVVLTNNYFVTAGADTVDKTLIMRRVPVGTVIPAFPAFFNNGYSYLCTNKFMSGVRATHIENDDVVMAAYFDSQIDPRTWMHLFTIKVPGAVMLHHQHHLMSVYPNPTGRLLPPKEMVYMPNYSALMVIDTISTLTHISHIVRLNPYPIGIPIGSLYMPPFYRAGTIILNYLTIKYNSLTSISSTTCIAAAGGRWLKLDLSTLPLTPSSTGCIEVETKDCFIDAEYSASDINEGTSMSYGMAFISYPSDFSNEPLTNQC